MGGRHSIGIACLGAADFDEDGTHDAIKASDSTGLKGAIHQALTMRIISGKGQVVHRRKGKNPWDAHNLPKLLQKRHGCRDLMPNSPFLSQVAVRRLHTRHGVCRNEN
jgi:hypothetical protein